MGDLFIECFYNNHMIDIGKTISPEGDREFIPIGKMDRSLLRSRTHYVIVPQDTGIKIFQILNFKELLHGTVLERPEDISNLIQPTDNPVIKGWTNDREVEFKQYLDRDFVQSMNILQQTGWKINTDVHNALVKE